MVILSDSEEPEDEVGTSTPEEGEPEMETVISGIVEAKPKGDTVLLTVRRLPMFRLPRIPAFRLPKKSGRPTPCTSRVSWGMLCRDHEAANQLLRLKYYL